MSNTLSLRNFAGYFDCYAFFGYHRGVCDSFHFDFTNGLYILQGEIDSGAWAVSYAISSGDKRKYHILLDDESEFIYNGQQLTLEQMWNKACYISTINGINDKFQKPVNKIIEKNIIKNNLSASSDEIRDIFHIDKTRYIRKISQVDNEMYRCKSAIGYSENKEIFCFPWISKSELIARYNHIAYTCNVLKNLNKIVLLPTSCDLSENINFKDAHIIKFYGSRQSIKEICQHGIIDSELFY